MERDTKTPQVLVLQPTYSSFHPNPPVSIGAGLTIRQEKLGPKLHSSQCLLGLV